VKLFIPVNDQTNPAYKPINVQMHSKVSDPHVPELPAGTVTLLFTDIEDSTRLITLLGDRRYSILLATHYDILRSVCAAENGHVVDTRGEEVFISFPRATDAINAAVNAQQAFAKHPWPDGLRLGVRMGLHTGEPYVAAEGYRGKDVHRAARIGVIGHGGQVLLSETTTSLVREELPHGVELLDLDQYVLEDVERPQRIHQLAIDGLRNEFPPLKSTRLVPDASTKWRMNKSKVKNQVVRASIGGMLAVAIISVISVLQLRLALPEEFAEAT
jgi:class 3 adenylate cyclase